MAAGRPTKYKEEYCQELVNHMSNGFSFESFAGIIEVCFDTLYEWKKVHPEFSEAHKKGLAVNLQYWEQAGIYGMKLGKDFNTPVWIFNMKNRHKWRDKHEVVTSDGEKEQPINGFVFIKDDECQEQ